MTRSRMHPLALALAGLALLALAALPAAAKPKKDREGDVAAILRGDPIYQDSLNSPELAKARQEVYRLEERMLRRVVLERLAREKPKEFTPPSIKVTEDEIRNIYEQAGLKSRGTLDSFRGRIRAFVIRNKSEEQERKLFEKAVRKGYVKSFLRSPPPFLHRLAPVSRPATTRGGAKAPIHIVEFSDFQWPFCDRVRGTLAEIEQRYKGQVKLVYRHLPLDEIHDFATPAAIASECAAEQGKFWAYHDLVFENRPRLSQELLLSLAPQAGVRNVKKFEACATSSRYRSRVQEDVEAAGTLGITGTPGFFIGTMGRDGLLEGEVITGARPVADFVAIIESVRARMKQ